MTTNFHTPISFGAPASPATINNPMAQLDAAITSVMSSAGAGGWASTTAATASAGQKVIPVVSTTGATAGMPFYLGSPGGQAEVGVIDTVQAGVSLTAVANLANTYAAGTTITATPGEIVDARGTAATLGIALDWIRTATSVGEYGATGNGTTDDTAAVQAAFSNLDSTVSDLYFPPGTYLVADTLDIPYTQYRRIRGAGPGASIIQMTAANKPIIRASVENTHTIAIEGLTLKFATNQPKTNTSAYGILLTETADTGSGFYFWAIRNVAIEGAAVGIGLGGAGRVPFWGSTLETVRFTNTSLHALDLVSPSTIGMPGMVLRDIKILNPTGSPITDPAYAVGLSAVEALIEGLDLEGWYDAAIVITGGSPVTIRGLHIEHHVLAAAYPSLVYIGDGPQGGRGVPPRA